MPAQKPHYDFLEEVFEGSGNRVDSRWIITRAVDRIHAICAYGQSEKQSVVGELPRRISLGATMLEAIVSPVVDQKYHDEINTFREKLLLKKEASDALGMAFDPELEYGLFRFGALIRLIDRHNLLFERYIKDFIGFNKKKKQEGEQELEDIEVSPSDSIVDNSEATFDEMVIETSGGI